MSDDIKKQFACKSITKNGERYFMDANGLVVDKPVSVYIGEFNKIREWLVKKFPELERQMYKMDPIFTSVCDTFATGYGNKLFLNPMFWNKLMVTSEEDFPEHISKSGKVIPASRYNYILFVMIHEMYHHIFGHMRLSKSVEEAFPDNKRRNMAMDYAINGLIEELYGMEGFTKRIHGLINNSYTGLAWESIYPIITLEELSRKNKPWTEKLDKDGVKEVNKKNSGGGIPPVPPSDENISIVHDDDFKNGYKDACYEIRSILNRIRGNNGTIRDLIDALEPVAKSYGVVINESVASFGSTESYDNGVRTAYAKVLEDLYSKINAFDKGENSPIDYETKSDLDNIFNDPSQGGDESDEKKNGDDKSNNSKEDGSDDFGDESSKSNNGSQGTNGQNDSQGKSEEGDSDNNDSDEDSYDDDWDSEMSDEDMRKALREEGFDPELNKSDENVSRDEIEKDKQDLEKHMEHIANDSKDEKAKDRAKDMKGKLNTLFKIDYVHSELDWKDLLEEFLNTTCSAKSDEFDPIEPLLGIHGDESPVPLKGVNHGGKEGMLKHIVIGLDQSGSVCSSGNVPKFIGELMNVIDDALKEDTIIDLIQFDDVINGEHRVLHKEGETETEIQPVRYAKSGGTDYYEVMKCMSILMDEWEDNIGNTDELGEVLSSPTIEDEDVPEAACSIIFTDSDFFSSWTKVYKDIDTDKLLIIGVDCDGRMKFDGDKELFRDCFYPISSKKWGFNESASDAYDKNKSLNEMFLGDDDEDIQSEIQSAIDKSMEEKNTVNSVSYLTTIMHDYHNVYDIEMSKMYIDSETDRIIIDSDIEMCIPNGPSLKFASITGYLKYNDLYSVPSNCIGAKVKKGIILDKCYIGYEEYKKFVNDIRDTHAGDSEYPNNVYYVNCSNILYGVYQEQLLKGNPLASSVAFSNNQDLVLPYLKSFVDSLNKINREPTYAITCVDITNEDVPFVDYTNGVPKGGQLCITPINNLGNIDTDTRACFTIRLQGAPNALFSEKKNKSEYHLNTPGFPPFVVINAKNVRILCVASKDTKDLIKRTIQTTFGVMKKIEVKIEIK